MPVSHSVPISLSASPTGCRVLCPPLPTACAAVCGRVAFEVSAGYIEAHPAVSQLLGEQPTVHPPSVVKDTICGPLVVGDVSIEEKAEACFHAMRQNAPFGMNVFCPMHGSLQPGEVHLTCTVQGKNIVIESVVIGGVARK